MGESWFRLARFDDDVAVYVEGHGAELGDETRRELERRWRSGSLRSHGVEIAIERGDRVARARAFEVPPGTRVLLVVRPEWVPPSLGVPLTVRQAQVLALMEEGRSIPEIAEQLGVAVATARRHQVDVFRKLDSAQREAAEQRVQRLADLGLSTREVDVVRYVCQGRSNAEIARALNLSTVTIGAALTTIYKKLGVHGRHALMAKVSRYVGGE